MHFLYKNNNDDKNITNRANILIKALI